MLNQWNRKDHDGISTRAPTGRLIETLEPRTLLSGGTLDPAFGQGGYVKGYAGMAVQSDGSIIAQQITPAGAIGSAGALVLMHPDGSIAGPYSGPVPQPPPTNVQADGKYLVVNGSSDVSGNTVTRHNRDGSVDTTFGNNGTVSDFTSGTPYVSFNPETITVQGNQILVGGRLVGAENTDYLAIVRLNSDGSIDRTFGVNGVAHGAVNDLADSTAYQIQIGPNTNLYEAGQQDSDPTLQDFTASGGFVAAQNILAPYDDHVYGLGFSFGKVYFLAGYESGYDVLAAYDLNLTPDTGFGDYGQVFVLPPDGDPNSPPPGVQPGRLLLGPDGRIFVSNYYDFEGAGTNSVYLIAYTPDWPASSGAISGFLYNDPNANGTKDASDSALRYWQAFADTNGNGIFDAGEPTAYSDYNGYYKIYGLTPGTYKVYEVVQNGWTRTEPAAAWPNSDHVVTVTAGVTSGNNNFGNTQPGSQPGSVSGTFFYDYNANGTWDGGESPSPSWLLYLDSNSNGVHDSGETEIRADGAGRYTFSNVAPGTYHIRPETASGWTETYPTGGTQTVTVGSGQIISGINFGEVRGTPTVKGSISGTVFYDKNGNGTWDSGEGISPYWLIYLDSNNNGVYDANEPQVRGDANGHYTFANLAPGSYSVRIRSASGWTQTYPASGGANLVTLGSGQNVSNANFGEVQGTPSTASGSISGTFFYDSNGNGAWDSNETYSPLWYLYIDANNDGRYDTGDKQIRTDSAGRYTFAGLAAGTYVIRAATASGWQQTFPSNGAPHVITLSAGQNVTGVNFGERRI